MINKALFQKLSNLMYLTIFFEMHNLYITWHYASQFITCKIVFFFVFGATFAPWNWQFISICSCVICG